ncbi:hypothetical protein JTE90_003438 [Oedothorax gibbosus]|uniref:Uncharacterized protein n=1 Tax=Oedothorax gibbosus TaxID=931172 RepID=A0AAV6TZV9_9ARAC|nr:hypothetical protein JTE90_003438 [Oedothorax gibbosus]
MDTAVDVGVPDVDEPSTSQNEEKDGLNKDPIYSFFSSVVGNKKVMICNCCKKEISRVELDRKILEMIAVGNYPFSIVQEEGFLRLVNYLNPQANLKSDKFYRDKMHATYDAVVKKVMDLISTAEHLSFTTDIWTNKAKTESLISLTAHYIDFINKTRPKVILAAKSMVSDHTGEEIKRILEEIVLF